MFLFCLWNWYVAERSYRVCKRLLRHFERVTMELFAYYYNKLESRTELITFRLDFQI